MRKFILLTILAVGTTIVTNAQTIKPEEVSKHIGDSLTVCGQIFGGRYVEDSKTKPTLLNMGAAFPNQPLTIVIFEDTRNKFGFKPEEKWINKEICVTGKIELYKGKPEIVVHDVKQVKE